MEPTQTPPQATPESLLYPKRTLPQDSADQVPPPTTPPTPAFSSYASMPPKKSKAWIIIVIIILLVLAGAAAAYAMGYISLPFTDPDPKADVQAMAVKLQDVKLLSFNTKMDIGVTSDAFKEQFGFSKGSLSINVTGSGDITEKENPKIDISTKISIDAQGDNAGSFKANTTLESLILNKEVYGKIEDFLIDYQPKTPNPMYSGVFGYMEGFVKSIKGRWIQLATEKEFQPYNTDIKEQNDTINKLKATLMKMEYVDSIQKVGSESISGQATRHYKVTIDLKKFQQIVNKEMGGQALSDREFDESMKNFSVEGVPKGKIAVDLWIGKKDALLYKSSIPKITVGEDYTHTNVTFAIQSEFSNYNKQLNLSKPSEFMTIDDLYNLDGPLKEARAKAINATIKANLSNLRPIAEIIHDDNGNSYASICKDNELNSNAGSSTFSLSATIESLLNAKKATTQAEAGITCVSSKTKYAISMPLMSGESWCLDSNGMFGPGKIDKNKLACTK